MKKIAGTSSICAGTGRRVLAWQAARHVTVDAEKKRFSGSGPGLRGNEVKDDAAGKNAGSGGRTRGKPVAPARGGAYILPLSRLRRMSASMPSKARVLRPL